MDRLLILLLSVLPKHLLSHLAGLLCAVPIPRFLRPLVFRSYCVMFGANAAEAEKPFTHYRTVNAWFTRALKPGLRPVASDGVVSPVDAAVGASGRVEKDTLVQAKGRTYSLAALLGDPALAARMEGGTFLTLYLAPKDYHRIHAPLDGTIPRASYIPGKLWPVNQAAVSHVDALFAVNERMVLQLHRPNGGIMAVVPVGATMVGMTRLVFDNLHTNAWKRERIDRDYPTPHAVQAGDPLGQFEFGSTVVLACTSECATLDPLEVGRDVKMGQKIGSCA
ncbi:MAG: phosphatidylserine decarboxylase [Deltaproteobacteria bacterium]|nr:phosphatidylserine decarboxylase [Deltaproteobacteria bacterium]